MTDTLIGLAGEARGNKFSTLGPDITDGDIASVWENVSNFIEKQMGLRKGVSIPGLGTFTFSQKKLDVGNNKYILIQRPIFQVSEKFAQIHNLIHTKHYTTGQISVVPLNFTALSYESPFSRDTVETCVKEVIGAINRTIALGKNVEFILSGIGRLQIRNNKVKMKFFKEFVTSMDGSGKLIDAMRNRPGTSDSVISNRPPTRAYSANTLVLPKLMGGTPDPMEAIKEEGNEAAEVTFAEPPLLLENAPKTDLDEGNTDSKDHLVIDNEPNPEEPDTEGVTARQILADPELKQILSEFDPDTLYEEEEEKVKLDPIETQQNTASIPIATGFSTDELLPSARILSRIGSVTSKSLNSPLHGDRSNSQISIKSAHTPRLLAPLDPALLSRSKSADKIHDHSESIPLRPPVPPPRSSGSVRSESSCGHQNSGQELCYLCHQRDARNVAISFKEERKKKEKEEDQLIFQYQQLKDTEHFLKEQERSLARKNDLQKMSAFNLGIAEAFREKRAAKPTHFEPSFVFQQRTLTPPHLIKQRIYANDLLAQIEAKKNLAGKQKEDNAFLERLEQVQLAEDLAAQREQYIKDRANQVDTYKKALSAQARYKPMQIPEFVPDSKLPIFGRHDMNNEYLAERRMKATELFREQKMTVEQRKREAILKRLSEQKEEEEMLQKTRENLQKDRAQRYEMNTMHRKELENSWFEAAKLKHDREKEEREHRMKSAKPLIDQVEHHKRCKQCKKKLNNCGESNIWHESRYIPGARIMV